MVREWDDADGSNAVKFLRNRISNLHSYKFGKEFLTQPRNEVEGQAQLVSTVAKNRSNHSDEQHERAKRAR